MWLLFVSCSFSQALSLRIYLVFLLFLYTWNTCFFLSLDLKLLTTLANYDMGIHMCTVYRAEFATLKCVSLAYCFKLAIFWETVHIRSALKTNNTCTFVRNITFVREISVWNSIFLPDPGRRGLPNLLKLLSIE